MRFTKNGFACATCVEDFAIENAPETAPKHWVLTAEGPSHAVEVFASADIAVIPCGEACEACGKGEPVSGEGMNLTWANWSELDV